MRPPVSPVAAWLLLIAFVIGGLVVPVAHEAAHLAEEMAAERALAAAHAAADHHHDADTAHGTEVQPACPDAHERGWTCPVCQAPTAHAVAASAFAGPSLRAAVSDVPPADALGRAAPADLAVRGPPAA
jgi:hypothetical protein